MNKIILKSLSILFCIFMFNACATEQSVKTSTISKSQYLINSLVRVNVTIQGYSYYRPWQKKSINSYTAIGVVVKNDQILVNSILLADHKYIELERIDTGEKIEAEMVVADYEANLALVRPLKKSFLTDMQPLELITDAGYGDNIDIIQVQRNGKIVPSSAPITSIELKHYSFGHNFLAYRLNSSLQYRFNNFTLPVVKNGKLAGLLLRYDSKAQTVDAISGPVIEHFLNDALNGQYEGFPLSGIRYASTADPQFRKYLKLPEDSGGVFIKNISEGSPAEYAGLELGDVLVEIAGYAIDNYGEYEHPEYGKIALTHLMRCGFSVGETIELKVLRSEKYHTITMKLAHTPATDYIVPTYLVGIAPKYYILGGMVLQELSIPYLKIYGSSWSTSAPSHLAYYASNQGSIDFGNRTKKIVFLSYVLPTSFTIGYDNLANLIITKINNHAINGLEDIKTALSEPVKGFHKIEFDQFPKLIFLDPEELPSIDEQIKEYYNIPQLSRM